MDAGDAAVVRAVADQAAAGAGDRPGEPPAQDARRPRPSRAAAITARRRRCARRPAASLSGAAAASSGPGLVGGAADASEQGPK